MSATSTVSSSGYQTPAVDQQVSKQLSRIITIEDPFEVVYYGDDKNKYVVKVCKINGQAKVGFTRFFWSTQYSKFIPGNACYMGVQAYRSFMQKTSLHLAIEKHAEKLIQQLICMSHCTTQKIIFLYRCFLPF